MRLQRFFVLSTALVLAWVGNAVAQNAALNDEPSGFGGGLWNTFLEQQNILECTSFEDTSAPLVVRFRDETGKQVAQTAISLGAGVTMHLQLNSVGLSANRYGTFDLSATGRSAESVAGKIACQLMVYRFRGADVEYAFVLPIGQVLSGDTWGIFNILNPAAAPDSTDNWLTVANLSPQTAQFAIDTFRMDGTASGTITASLPALSRRDFYIGSANTPVGLYRIRPLGPGSYSAVLMRYIHALTHTLAMPLRSSGAAAGEFVLPLSTMAQTNNWIEIANAGQSAAQVRLEYFSQIGAPLGVKLAQISPRSQVHVFANAILGEQTVGSVRVSAPAGAQILAQSMHYGVTRPTAAADGPPDVRWVYGMQGTAIKAIANQRYAVLLNTFLRAANWHKTIGVQEDGAGLEHSVFRTNGSSPVPDVVSVGPLMSLDFPEHGSLGFNQVGASVIKAAGDSQEFVSTAIRVYSDARGEIRYIAALPSIRLANPALRLGLQLAVTGLTQPVALAATPDTSGRMCVVERTGRIRILQNGALLPEPLLDLTGQVATSGEMGLLGVAFHPLFASNGVFFVHYNAPDRASMLVRYKLRSDNPNRADAATAVTLLRVAQDTDQHKGGQIAFGPDGYLYIGLGDGSLAEDPQGRGRDTALLYGKILRLDVSDTASGTYRIPADNPFVGSGTSRPEIWAYGFRNPWRFSFDRITGQLFVGDVGQAEREEVDIVLKGRDYGWSTMEGSLCFRPRTGCSSAGLEMPIGEYTHQEGVAIIGGYVYRGNALPQLSGQYVFGDYASGRIWTLSKKTNGSWERQLVFESDSPLYISSFGEDRSGELFVTDIFGKLFRVIQQ